MPLNDDQPRFQPPPGVSRAERLRLRSEWLRDVHVREARTAMPVTAPPVRRSPEPIGEGVGTELERLLSDRWGARAGTSCRMWAKKMNAWGPAGCQARIQEIARHLVAQSHSYATRHRRWWLHYMPAPLKRLYCRRLVRLAIAAARRES